MSTTQTYDLTLRIEKRQDGDEMRRLRAALKCLKRAYGLACTRIVPAVDTDPQPPASLCQIHPLSFAMYLRADTHGQGAKVLNNYVAPHP